MSLMGRKIRVKSHRHATPYDMYVVKVYPPCTGRHLDDITLMVLWREPQGGNPHYQKTTIGVRFSAYNFEEIANES